ncbi:MAG: rubredoxin [Bacilli bacterium]
MKKYKCPICGYIYDEEKGIPEKGIAPGTKWSDLPNDWKCPICGVPKDTFEEIKETVKEVVIPTENDEELREISYGELGAICSNLAKGCEKQYLDEESNLFNDLANYFDSKRNLNENKNYDDLLEKVNINLEKDYSRLKELCLENNDRATLRAITWGEKTTIMLKSLMERFQKEGSSFLENTNVYVCDICGFIYIGDDVPSVCPICKVPSLKILQVKGA